MTLIALFCLCLGTASISLMILTINAWAALRNSKFDTSVIAMVNLFLFGFIGGLSGLGTIATGLLLILKVAGILPNIH